MSPETRRKLRIIGKMIRHPFTAIRRYMYLYRNDWR